MDYTTRTILQDEQGYYRLFNGERIDTNKHGDVYLEISKELFNAPLPADMKSVIEQFYPSLGEVNTLRDVFFVEVFITRDDDKVCFKSGIYDKISNGYTRTKHTSDFEFNSFIGVVKSSGGAIYKDNPYITEEI